MSGGATLKPEFKQVRAILWTEWDPIGCGVPEDEYDDYVWPVILLLRAGAKREALVAFLAETASATLGCDVPDSRNGRVANSLLALGL